MGARKWTNHLLVSEVTRHNLGYVPFIYRFKDFSKLDRLGCARLFAGVIKRWLAIASPL